MTHRSRLLLGFAALILGATCTAACDDASNAAGSASNNSPETPKTSFVVQAPAVPQDALAALRKAGLKIALTDRPVDVSAQDAIAEVRAERPELSVRAKRITASLAHVSSQKDQNTNRPGFVDELTWIVVLHDVPSASYSSAINDPHPVRSGPDIPFVVAFVSHDAPVKFLATDFFRPTDQRS